MPVVRADKLLFERWDRLALRIGALKAICQNDVEVSDEQVSAWVERASELRDEMERLIGDTMERIYGTAE